LEKAKAGAMAAELRLGKATTSVVAAQAYVARCEERLEGAYSRLRLAEERVATVRAKPEAEAARTLAMAEMLANGATLQAVGAKFGVSKERVRQIVVGTAWRKAGRPSRESFDWSAKGCAKALAKAIS
jgi:hypothetical protein